MLNFVILNVGVIILAQAGIARGRIETDPSNSLRLKGTEGITQNIHFNLT